MPRSLSSTRSRGLFAWLCLGVAGAALLAVQLHQRRGLQVPEWPLAFDLFLTVPVAYLLVLRPRPKQALLGLAAIFSIGVVFGSVVLPQESKVLWLWLEPLRWIALAALLAWQGWALAQIGLSLAHAPAGENLESRLHASFERRFGVGPMTELLKAEGRLWLYAFCRNPSRLHFADGEAYPSHRQGGNASNQFGFFLLVAVELPVAHGLLHLFSPVLAMVVSAATLYGLLFLWAEYRATLLRPTTVTASGVHVRHGVMADLWLPKTAIVELRSVNDRPGRAPRRLRLVGMGKANVLIRLAAGTRLRTPFGEREVTELHIGLDDADRFIRAVRALTDRAGDPSDPRSLA